MTARKMTHPSVFRLFTAWLPLAVGSSDLLYAV